MAVTFVVVVVVVHSTTLDILLWQDTIDEKMGSQVLAIRKWRCVQFVFFYRFLRPPAPNLAKLSDVLMFPWEAAVRCEHR